jgi:hypothetical protein
MFLDADGALITVAIDTDGQPDWPTAGEIHYTHALAPAQRVLAHLLAAIALLTPPAGSRMAAADAWLIRGLIDVIATQVRHGEDLEHGDAAPHRQPDTAGTCAPATAHYAATTGWRPPADAGSAASCTGWRWSAAGRSGCLTAASCTAWRPPRTGRSTGRTTAPS